jgi:phosphate transport system permease protein
MSTTEIHGSDELEAIEPEVVEPAPSTPRRLRRNTLDDYLELGGSLVASLALVGVLYGHVLATRGLVGFIICWFCAFIAIYAVAVRFDNPRAVVIDRVVQATIYALSAIVVVALASAVVYIFARGWQALSHTNFYTHDMAGVSPDAPLSQGGIYHAILGTIVEIAVAVAISLPFGLITAVYMSEVGGRWSSSVRTVVEAMTALPEILAALFVYVVLVVDFGWPKSGFAVSVAMSVTMVPIIARTGEVALRIVPNGLREASNALGGSQWRTTWKVVLPSARAGLATALILSIARGIGETAIPLLLSGASSFVNVNPLTNPMNSLPLFIYSAYVTHEPIAIERAFGAASVLLIMVLTLFVATRIVARDRKGSR